MGPTLAHGRATLDSFEFFYARHEGILRRTMARHLKGRVELDDALQEALMRIAQEFASWPSDDRLRNALRIVRSKAIDALRSEHGTAGRPEVTSVDFEELERVAADVLAAWTSDCDPATAVAERAELMDLLSRLHEDEVPVVLGIAHLGGTTHEVADDLKLPQGTVAHVYDEARTFLRGLLGHVRGGGLAGPERLRLIQLEAGRLRGRDRRRTHRHLDHCELCRSIEVLERRQAASADYDGPERRRSAGGG